MSDLQSKLFQIVNFEVADAVIFLSSLIVASEALENNTRKIVLIILWILWITSAILTPIFILKNK